MTERDAERMLDQLYEHYGELVLPVSAVHRRHENNAVVAALGGFIFGVVLTVLAVLTTG